ncbi:NADH dehydrogenase [ubiquinone] 1 beta subcomplex subunit 11, mitochondrial [Petromyzon marinus]|uniref:NADH dehydrogenase [ubiquinone] 1 beta subcomplex subunit 11, mitochondrial n=1 Tax=Petromyzon marinus TaxID=7757 RepID=A0AAJ7U2T6_PETMA|nr:NADH dehydrogenase [ubiquinone] 1 beta subcomplex subunit 11, mitochondrial [Petromyzon marinus]
MNMAAAAAAAAATSLGRLGLRRAAWGTAARGPRFLGAAASEATTSGRLQARAVSNTPHNKTTSLVGQALTQSPGGGHGHGEDGIKVYEKNWEHHGFSDDSVADLWNMRLAFFSGLSVAIVLGAIFVHYLPEPRVWFRREAERLVRERESAGLPILTPDYYDRDSIVLPSVEEEEEWVLAHKREQ